MSALNDSLVVMKLSGFVFLIIIIAIYLTAIFKGEKSAESRKN